MPHPFDATLKDILTQAPADFRAAFHLPKAEPVSALNVDLSTISAATDVALGFGQPVGEIVDLNFQSGPDSTVAARLHVYNAVLHLKFGVPVRSVLVLLRAKADHRTLTGKLSYVSGGKRVAFEYDVIRLWRESAALFLHGGIGLLPLATLCKMPGEQSGEQSLEGVVREIEARLSDLPDHAQAVRLMSAAYTLAASRFSRETLAQAFGGVTIMHKPSVLDEIEEIEIRTSHKMLLRQGRQKFGEPDRKTEAALHRIKEIPRLERMADAILTLNSWKDLLAVR